MTIPATVKTVGAAVVAGRTVTCEITGSGETLTPSVAVGGSAVTAALGGLGAGTYSAVFTAKDAEGNVTATSEPIAFTIASKTAVDKTKIRYRVGEGTAEYAVVLRFGDYKGMDNLVFGVRGELTDDGRTFKFAVK